MGKKVAYAVFNGRLPGIYMTWDDAQAQVNGFSKAKYQGYTIAQGGISAARRDWNAQNADKVQKEAERGAAARGQQIPHDPLRYKSAQGQNSSGSRVLSEFPVRDSRTHVGDQYTKKRKRPVSWDSSDTTTTEVPHTHGCDDVRGAISTPVVQSATQSEAKPCVVYTAGRLISAAELVGARCSRPLELDQSITSPSDTDITSFQNSDSDPDPPFQEGLTVKEIDALNLPALIIENQRRNALLDALDHYIDNGLEAPQRLITALCTWPPIQSSIHYQQQSPAPSYIALEDSDEDSAPPNKEDTTDIAPSAEPPLSEEQQRLVDVMMEGKNVFFTGSAGTGKSTTLQHFIRQKREAGIHVDIVAPTGRAALAVNGMTIFRYAGWTPNTMKMSMDELGRRAHGELIYRRLTTTQILVIDEISMVENLVFERLNNVMQSARNNMAPFGGVQLIVTGDFCQLPPVRPFSTCIQCGKSLAKHNSNLGQEEYVCECGQVFAAGDKWAFCSTAWDKCAFKHVRLNTIHRQSDSTLVDILENYRLGIPLSTAQKSLLLDHESETTNATKLFPKKREVTAVNEREFRCLKTDIHDYQAYDDFDWNSDLHPELEDRFGRLSNDSLMELAEDSLEYNMHLREHMVVILLTNLDIRNGLANGSQGIIVGFDDHCEYTMPDPIGEDKHIRRMMIERYVQMTKVKRWPSVQFSNGETRIIYPICRINHLSQTAPYSYLSRSQIPLMAGWALTIHKAQGMTLDRVIVELEGCFEAGQAYVALSRARSLIGLTVRSLEKKHIAVDPKVKAFMYRIDLQMKLMERAVQ